MLRTAGSMSGSIEFQEEADATWCAARFASLSAADACAAALHRALTVRTLALCQAIAHLTACLTPNVMRTMTTTKAADFSSIACVHAGDFDDVTVCMEPNWRAFGTHRADNASAHLVLLAESLGCRSGPRVLSRPQAMCLARGREAILAAVERAGGHAWTRQLAAPDPDAAACLCLSLQQAVADSRRRWLPDGARRSVEAAFAPLGPSCMHIVAAQLREGVPGSAQRALAVVRLQGGFLRMHCQCCSQGANAREREQLAQKV
jgi:hypothetical protein